MDAALARIVTVRSQGRCEAVWHDGYRCLNRADHIHHRLPKSRGGRILDRHADACNLAHVCQPCHQAAHGNPQRGRAVGLIVPGEVRTGLDGRPVYTGPSDEYQQRWNTEDEDN